MPRWASWVDTGDSTRDDHLRSRELLDVANHPMARFRSPRLAWNGRTGTLSGELTIKGVTRTVELDVEFLGAVIDPWDNQRAVFDAHGRINREDWGVSWNTVLESGGLLGQKDIDLVFHVDSFASHPRRDGSERSHPYPTRTRRQTPREPRNAPKTQSS
jgi:hypothetical protein